MAPKKAAAAAAEGDKDYDGENKFLAKRLEVLQYRLMIKDDSIAECMRDEETFKKTIQELDVNFNEEGERSSDNCGEMHRQYLEMQNSFNERIEYLQLQVGESKKEIQGVREEIERTAIEKDELISQKDEEIRGLTLRMESLAFEFSDMLKETLDKMSQRVEVTHSSWDRDSSKPPLMNRLKEFSLTTDA